MSGRPIKRTLRDSRLTGPEDRTMSDSYEFATHTLTEHVRRLPDGLMATLTWDRSLELAAHRTFSIATGVQVYFCVPRRVGQRPSAVPRHAGRRRG